MDKKRVVIVDDDQGLADTISSILSNEGYITLSFTSCSNFIDQLDAISPDLIVMDVRLPDGAGDHLARDIKRIPAFRAIPIILISASENLPQIAQSLDIQAYLEKPFDFDKFLKTVNFCLT